MMGIEIVYASVTAFISPILLLHGMSREQANMVWAGGPLIGLLLSPVLGSLSDRCKFSIGRRRPFIILLAFLDVLGKFNLKLLPAKFFFSSSDSS